MTGPGKPPSFQRELWGITRVMIAVIASGLALVFAVFWLADAEHHPVRAVIVLYSIVLLVMVGGMAWWSYRWKRREWERQQKFEAGMNEARRVGKTQ